MEQGILNQGATEEKGEIARLASFVGAMAISDLVKTTLGPKGMDKILQSMVRHLQLLVHSSTTTADDVRPSPTLRRAAAGTQSPSPMTGRRFSKPST